MNREESKVTHIVKIPRETIDCAKCKHCGEQTCVPYGFSCQYEPIIPRSTVRISQKQINDINKVVKQLRQENKKCKEVIEKAIEYIKIYRSYQKINNKDYLKGRDEIGCLDICQVDELLDILKEVK